MEIKNNNGIIAINTKVFFNTEKTEVKIDNLGVDFPGEYEKGGILLEVKEYEGILFYSFSIEGKNLLILTNDSFEQKEEILSFFGDVDILIIVGSKASAKIFENIEARIVIPYGTGKDIFLNTLGQNIEEINSYKTKSELPADETQFVNLV